MTTTLAPPPIETPELPPAKSEPELPAPKAPPVLQEPRPRGILAGAILIALGIVALVGNVLPIPGALLFLGLGTAFLVARVVTGRCGYAVPAGILLGFGTFVALTEIGLVSGRESGGAFFIFLGVGFIASYLIAANPGGVWPIVPAAALIGFGLFLQGFMLGWPLEQFVGLANYWPLALVLFGLWLLVRDRVAPAWHGPLTVLGASGLILVGFMVAAAGVISVATPAGRFTPFPIWPGFGPMPMFGTPPLQDTIVLNAPIASGQTLRLYNPSGTTTVRATTDTQMRVEAVRHYFTAGPPPDVALVPDGNGVLVQVTRAPVGPGATSTIDFTIDMPAGAGADIGSASGDIRASGISGPVTLHTVSGSIVADRLAGDAQLNTTSGGIRATDIARLREARTVSGGIEVSGAFQTDATISTTSGGVVLRFDPAASVRVNAATISGGVRTSGAGMPSVFGDARRGSVTLGAGAAQIDVRTTSGGIDLVR